MSDATQNKKTDWFSLLVVIAIIWGVLHYLLTGFFFGIVDSACRESSERYNATACDCRISKYRSSLLLENYIFGEIGDRYSAIKAKQILYNTMAACPNPR
ncbi:MAG: hypothetical protein ACSHW0_09615 [Thalassotalea sp.]